jgi:hypothetical protein
MSANPRHGPAGVTTLPAQALDLLQRPSDLYHAGTWTFGNAESTAKRHGIRAAGQAFSNRQERQGWR